MPDPVAAATLFSAPPACVLLDEFASFGHRRNTTTATALTSAGRTVDVSFELVDPPGISRWFVHCPNLEAKRCFNGSPQILNAADALVVMRMAFFSRKGRVIDYFVYRAGHGKPSLDLIPGPYPTVLFPKQVGILPRGGGVSDCGHYSVVFPVQRLDPQLEHEIFVFSSESRAWSSKVARFSQDRETTYDEVVLHSPTKAMAAGCGSLAWIDLWRGILLCTWLDEQPVLRLIQWPVPAPCDVLIDISSPHETRDATLINGVIRFVELKLRHNGGNSYFSDDATNHGWKATIWKREISSTSWNTWLSADTSKIFASDSSSSHLRQKLWEDGVDRQDLNKVVSASPRLSLQNEDVMYIMAMRNSCDLKASLLAVNAREERLEAVEQEQIPLRQRFCPCTFSSFLGTSPEIGIANPSDKCDNREKMERVGIHLLAALDELKDIEKNLPFHNPRNDKSRLLLCSGSASSLRDNVDAVVDHCSVNNQANPVIHAVHILGECLRILADMESQMSAPIEAIKSNISLVLGQIEEWILR